MSNAAQKEAERPQNVNVIFTRDLIERVDEHVGRMRKRAPGQQITRSDAVRELILKGLAEFARAR